ncbi:ABC transporter substrate-binding protein [Faunimonas pinastri]|nr:ABC transporter substrate-binding protein [Faunimonas pinastri]
MKALKYLRSLALGAAGFALAASALTGEALALDKVSFGTNWLAEAEHGGFYQAVADGTYKKYGLDVTIVQGGPQAANQALLMADKIQFYMQGNLIGDFSAVEQGVPVMEVAAVFQKDPQGFLAHPDAGATSLGDLSKAPVIYMGKEVYANAFQWIKANFKGFKDEQYRPYTFSPAPFLANKDSAQQAYVTSEPYEIEKQAGWKPKVFLFADAGFSTYSEMIEAKVDYVAKNPDIVQRFVDATTVGWYNYLYGDNKAANDLIKKDNPDMTDGQIAYSIKAMKDSGLLESGDALTKGIGCMTDARVKDFYGKMVKAGVVKADLDVSKIYTTRFVCKGVGMDIKK